jgi:ribosomal protein S18 acetylase RimI-like enzyme
VEIPVNTRKLTVKPLTIARWPDFEAIFTSKGCSIARGCWCMFYRRSGGHGTSSGGRSIAESNRLAHKALTSAGEFTGLIGYRGKQPVGWISFGPREGYKKLVRSSVMKAVDAQPVWSIICFVVPQELRGEGIARALLDAAIAYAKKRGVKLLEAYPVDKSAPSRDDSMWFGAKSMYDAAGFEEVARRKPHRPVVRLRPK